MKQRLLATLGFILLSSILSYKLSAQVNTQDSLVLVDIYSSTNGPNWGTQGNWLTSAPVSTWAGITVENNHVIKVNIGYDTRVKGKLPLSIGNLTELVELRADDCNLKGNLPYTIGKLTKLQVLTFSFAHGLTGSIPASFGI